MKIHLTFLIENKIYLQVPAWKKIWKPKWIETKVAVEKDVSLRFLKDCRDFILTESTLQIQVPAWKQYWIPQWVKKGIPGEKFLGKDHEGWEYTSHDLWKKKLV